MKKFKTNVSIKFNSVDEYKEIEKKLIYLGYINDIDWNRISYQNSNYVVIYEDRKFTALNFEGVGVDIIYNSLEEFLKD